MSMFSRKPKTPKNLAEVFPPGTPFRMLSAEQRGMVNSPQTGERRAATINVSAVESPDVVLSFGVWGSLADQLTELEAGELPAIVTLTDESGMWQFAPHGPQGTTTIEQPDGEAEEVPLRVSPEAHMDFSQVTEPPHVAGGVERPASPTPPVDPAGGHSPPVSVDPPSVRPTPIDDSQTFQPGS